MENKDIDRLFREGLSAQNIQASKVFSREHEQWDAIQPLLNQGEPRTILMYRPLLILLFLGLFAFLGYQFYSNSSDLNGNSPLKASESPKKEDQLALHSNSTLTDSSSGKNTSDELDKIQSDVMPGQGLATTIKPDEHVTSMVHDAVIPQKEENSVPFKEKMNTIYQQMEDTRYEMNFEEKKVQENDFTDSVSPSRSMVKTSFLEFRTSEISQKSELAGWMIERNEPIYLSKLVKRPRLALTVGMEWPVAANQQRVENIGFAFSGGMRFTLHRKWQASFDYNYQSIDRIIYSHPNTFNLPFLSTIYEQKNPTSSNIQFESHGFRTGIHYNVVENDRFQMTAGLAYELINRTHTTGTYTYEGVYQLETESFEDEAQIASSQNISTSIQCQYRIVDNIYLTGRYRYLQTVGNGIDWKLNHRTFLGLTYKL